MGLTIGVMRCRGKQKSAEIAAREAAKGARHSAAASATVVTSIEAASKLAPRVAQGPSSANSRAVSTAPPPALTACAPPGFENMGGNGGISGPDNGRRFGFGDDAASTVPSAATKQLPQLPSSAEESPGLPVPLPAQSSAPGVHDPILAGQGVQ